MHIKLGTEKRTRRSKEEERRGDEGNRGEEREEKGQRHGNEEVKGKKCEHTKWRTSRKKITEESVKEIIG